MRTGRQHRHRVFGLLHDCSTRFLGWERALHRCELSQPMPPLLPAVLVLQWHLTPQNEEHVSAVPSPDFQEVPCTSFP